jgi:preprotein translocase subunit SecE
VREKTKARPGGVTRAPQASAREAGRPAQRQKAAPRFRMPNFSGAEGRTRSFFRDTRMELRRVVWPTREEAINLTLIVIAVSVAVGAFLGGVDYIFRLLFESLIGGL